jgi:hypothetical protein
LAEYSNGTGGEQRSFGKPYSQGEITRAAR